MQLRGVGIPPETIIIGSDPAGFVYCQATNREVFSLDTDGGGIEPVAESLDDFFARVVFGPDAAWSYGADWLLDLIAHGLVDGSGI